MLETALESESQQMRLLIRALRTTLTAESNVIPEAAKPLNPALTAMLEVYLRELGVPDEGAETELVLTPLSDLKELKELITTYKQALSDPAAITAKAAQEAVRRATSQIDQHWAAREKAAKPLLDRLAIQQARIALQESNLKKREEKLTTEVDRRCREREEQSRQKERELQQRERDIVKAENELRARQARLTAAQGELDRLKAIQGERLIEVLSRARKQVST